MAISVYCLAQNGSQVARICDRLKDVGFPADDISVVAPEGTSQDVSHTHHTKAPEGAATGAGTGAVLGGAAGWLAGIGALAIPGVGPLIAAGPIMAALSGAALGTAVGGLTGALVGAGIPEYEAQHFEGRIRQGQILIAVHTDDPEEAALVKEVFAEAQAQNISTGVATGVTTLQ